MTRGSGEGATLSPGGTLDPYANVDADNVPLDRTPTFSGYWLTLDSYSMHTHAHPLTHFRAHVCTIFSRAAHYQSSHCVALRCARARTHTHIWFGLIIVVFETRSTQTHANS